MNNLLFILMILPFSLLAQLKCPSLVQESLQLGHNSVSRSNPIILPVVFHILKAPNEEEIDDSTIRFLLEQLNEAFNVAPLDIDRELIPLVGTAGFLFKLAELDPLGNTTTGIERKDTPMESLGDLFSSAGKAQIKLENEGGIDPWDTENYVNIWVGMRSLSLGYTVTENTQSNDIEGIVLSSTAVQNQDKTLIHEMGHYLGLLHPWGNRTGCDSEEDGIADTPFQSVPNFDCEILNSCGTTSFPGNFMDFSADECLQFFTKLQVHSMQNFLIRFKDNLIDSDDCFVSNLPPPFTVNTIYNDNGLQIYLGNFESDLKVSLFSMSGLKLRSWSLESETYLNMRSQGIPSGIYVLHLITSDGLYQEGMKILIY